jgi:hypothetical protein
MIPSQIKKLLAAGYTIEQVTNGWRCAYKAQEIGIFTTEKTARRAVGLWSMGFRFDQMRAEYELPTALKVMLEKWQTHERTVIECVKLGGGEVRKKNSPTGRLHKPESLEKMRERMRQTRLMRHRRIDAFAGEIYDAE